jgi:predicted house-cleaning noncanonical NTP pyrophosphatase (MazG superfamily)
MKQHHKLVRDKIPEICAANGEIAETRVLKDDSEYLEALTDKLCEEAAEVQDTPSLEELADVLEVMYSIGKRLGLSPPQIEEARAKKAAQRGGFDGRIFLVSTKPML